jgi:3-isopropylmalate dehydratase small subunit
VVSAKSFARVHRQNFINHGALRPVDPGPELVARVFARSCTLTARTALAIFGRHNFAGRLLRLP